MHIGEYILRQGVLSITQSGKRDRQTGVPRGVCLEFFSAFEEIIVITHVSYITVRYNIGLIRIRDRAPTALAEWPMPRERAREDWMISWGR